MNKLLLKILFGILMLSPFLTYGHEGHGVATEGVRHYLLSPGHSIPVVLVLCVGIYLIQRKFAKKSA